MTVLIKKEQQFIIQRMPSQEQLKIKKKVLRRNNIGTMFFFNKKKNSKDEVKVQKGVILLITEIIKVSQEQLLKAVNVLSTIVNFNATKYYLNI